MNDQVQMMNQPSQLMSQTQMLNQSQTMKNMSQLQMLNPQQVMNQKTQILNQPLHPPQLMSQTQMMMNQTQSQEMSESQILNRSYHMWPPMEQLKFQNHMQQPSGFVSSKRSKLKPLDRGNWKGKKMNDTRKDGRRKEKPAIAATVSGVGVVGAGGSSGYKPPSLNELQYQNRMKSRKFYPKKKFNNNNNHNNRSAPFAPRNTTSFIIRAKKSGGIASLVSPCPVTPAVLPTPIFSPSREVLVDMAKEEWGVDGYGSMKGLIRLRSPGNEMEMHDEEEEEEGGGGSSESDVEEHVEVERRLDHDLSRFEMIYPNYGSEYNNVLENRVDDQDTHIAQLEEENLILKERLFLMEREMGDLRRRLLCLERQNHGVDEVHEEVVENESEAESESLGDARMVAENNEEVVEENNEGVKNAELKEENNKRSVKAKDGNNVNIESSENNAVYACVEEVARTRDQEIAEKDEMIVDCRIMNERKNETNDEAEGCLEKSIVDDDLSSCPR